MTIGIMGLGLIGGSLARALHESGEHRILGADAIASAVLAAKMVNAIDAQLTDENVSECDVIIVCIYPREAVEYIERIAPLIKKGAIVTDVCGVKGMVCEAIEPIAKEHGFNFIGAHPMGGTNRAGFSAARADMFHGASLILTPFTGTPIAMVDSLRRLFLIAGFEKTKVLSPKEHDSMIAYTSQLTHVLSSAYASSGEGKSYDGFVGGSFKDATRVAKLNPDMWTELCMDNKEALTERLDKLMDRLQAFRDALTEGDTQNFHDLLEDGINCRALTVKD